MVNERSTFRARVYARLEQDQPVRWEGLRGCTVRHSSFGHGVISRVMMPDWSNPVHLAALFASGEKVFHLSSLGDRTKFPEISLPEQLAAVIARAEQDIAGEEQRVEDDRRRKESEAQDTARRRREREAARIYEQRRAADQEAIAQKERLGRQLADVGARLDMDGQITDGEMRLLVEQARHELLLGYCERSYARAHDYREIVKASATWCEAREPDYALRATALLMDGIDRRPASVRATIFMMRATAFLDLHRFPEAKDSARRAVDCAGNRPHPHHLLGVILMACGDTADGEMHFAQARGRAGSSGVGRLEKAQQAEVMRQMQSRAVDPARQKAFAQDLLRADPRRYSWAASYIRYDCAEPLADGAGSNPRQGDGQRD